MASFNCYKTLNFESSGASGPNEFQRQLDWLTFDDGWVEDVDIAKNFLAPLSGWVWKLH